MSTQRPSRYPYLRVIPTVDVLSIHPALLEQTVSRLLMTIDARCQRFAWRFDLGGLDSQRAFEEEFLTYNHLLDADPALYDFVLIEARALYVRALGLPEGETTSCEAEILIRARSG